MIIYYEKDNTLDVEVYNGLLELKKALQGETPFDDSTNIAIRSGELFMQGLNGKSAIQTFCDEMAMEIQASNMIEVYFAPTDEFISREEMVKKIRKVLPEVDEDLYSLIMVSLYPDTFFGKFDEDALEAEIKEAYESVLEQL